MDNMSMSLFSINNLISSNFGIRLCSLMCPIKYDHFVYWSIWILLTSLFRRIWLFIPLLSHSEEM